MLDNVKNLLEELKNTAFNEPLLTIFDVIPEVSGEGQINFKGKVLEEADKETLKHFFAKRMPNARLNLDQLQIMQTAETPILRVNKNLSSMHREKSFHTELMTQMFYGDPIAVLAEDEDWVLGRNMLDGYISWTYKKYLSQIDWQEPTHLVSAPASAIYSSPDRKEQIGRALGGLKTVILEELGDMALIAADYQGWVEKSALTAYADLPQSGDALRNLVCNNALKLIGVPYLWGGNSVNGIDCSGLVQWAYRMSGLQTRRDAHMQYIAEKSVEPPFLPGDVVLYGKSLDHISHASISLGGWTVIHSSRTRNGVYIDDALTASSLKGTFVAAVRYI
jgi:cell wall-associated NlpC family hydrolase